MSSDIPYAYAAPAVVYGIVVEDPRAAILVRRVLNLSIVMGILGIISVIIRTSMPHPQIINTGNNVILVMNKTWDREYFMCVVHYLFLVVVILVQNNVTEVS